MKVALGEMFNLRLHDVFFYPEIKHTIVNIFTLCDDGLLLGDLDIYGLNSGKAAMSSDYQNLITQIQQPRGQPVQHRHRVRQ